MYASMEEILNAVAAGELKPEEADREIEALQARAGAAGSRAQQSARRSVSGIYGRDIGADVAGSVRGIVGGSIADGVHIGGDVTGVLGGSIGTGAGNTRIEGGVHGIIGGGIADNVQVDGDVTGVLGGPIGRNAQISGSVRGPVGGSIRQGARIGGSVSEGAAEGAVPWPASACERLSAWAASVSMVCASSCARCS